MVSLEGGIVINNRKKEELIQLLESHKIWLDSLGLEGKKLVLDEVKLTEVDLIKYPLNQAYITDCIFNNMHLLNIEMYSSTVCSSSFVFANLENADFYKADVSYANFTNANLQNTRFAKSDCIKTIFNSANLSDAKLVAALFDNADFRNANLQHADVSESTFENVLLKGAKLTGVRGLEEAFIKSINIGTPEQPNILIGGEARKWLEVMSN
ncbi:pentapeptide repeat-containing protein [Priestia megaterium]|uniref:pentapeptide repeat-containing protein n=1 Tax=Priestia megaterium TaxID=1404 RepID=UPI002877CFC5|nr:pentapeptide repeat-containing protein [Priestia megaterium]